MSKKTCSIAAVVVMLVFVVIGGLFTTGDNLRVRLFKVEPTSVPVKDQPSNAGDLLEGTWVFECDESRQLGQFTWTSNPFVVADRQLIAKAVFSQSGVNQLSDLAFTLHPVGHETTRLQVTKRGELLPGRTGFGASDFVSNYPGGYPAFEADLLARGVDWVNLYQLIKIDWELQQQLTDLGQCQPKPPRPPVNDYWRWQEA